MPAYIPTEEIRLAANVTAAQAADDSPEAAGFMRRHNVLLIHHARSRLRPPGDRRWPA